jgi:hypothetical protein
MSFVLPLSAAYRLTSDAENVILQHKISRKDGREWKSIAYYQTIGRAVEGYCRLRQRTSEAKGWPELRILTDRLVADIRAIAEKVDVRFSDTAKDLRA